MKIFDLVFFSACEITEIFNYHNYSFMAESQLSVIILFLHDQVSTIFYIFYILYFIFYLACSCSAAIG